MTAEPLKSILVPPVSCRDNNAAEQSNTRRVRPVLEITLITGGAPHYEVGLLSGLVQQDLKINVVGGADLESVPSLQVPQIHFTNLYEGPGQGGSRLRKVFRVLRVYLRFMRYASRSKARLFHIQWHYKLAALDRTIVSVWYKLLGKKLVFTAHNLDGYAHGRWSLTNHLSLWFFYRLVDHLIVHTKRMKDELSETFGVSGLKISVIPHGLMTAVPETGLDRGKARQRLGLAPEARVILAFGLISPYKGLEHLVTALAALRKEGKPFTCIIAGRIKECQDYWDSIAESITRAGLAGDVISDLRHVPDEMVETYFKAADVLVMPYRNLFQSGVLFLAYRFGLPVIATDVGSLREDIVEGKTGFVARADDPGDLAVTIERYFASELYRNLDQARQDIRDYAEQRYSWSAIGELTRNVYDQVMGQP